MQLWLGHLVSRLYWPRKHIVMSKLIMPMDIYKIKNGNERGKIVTRFLSLIIPILRLKPHKVAKHDTAVYPI